MRLFLYEYTCAATLADHPQLADLRPEGRAMLAAVLADAARVDGLEVHTLLSRDCGLTPPTGVHLRWFEGGDEETACRAAAQGTDFTWVIAPECGDILATRCRWMREAGGQALNCSLAAIELASDKLASAACWRHHGVPTPMAIPWPGPIPAGYFPAVCKPRQGAGAQDTYLVQSPEELATIANADPMILTEYIPGQPASSTWLIGPHTRLPLRAGRQLLSNDGRFHYHGGELPLPAELERRALGLSAQALDAIPGLLGYVGIDLVLGREADGSTDRLIEVNPRLTTSYLGLRRLTDDNLVQALLNVTAGRTPTLAWREGPLRFAPHS